MRSSVRAKLSDRVAESIGADILAGKIRPGERIPPEADLCEQMGVSRTVIRDAIRTLSALGLVEVHQGLGTIVTPPSSAAFGEALAVLLARRNVTMGEIIDARAAIEIGVVPAARTDAADLAEISACLDRFSHAVSSRAWVDAQDAHGDFHRALIRSLHNPVVELLLEPMHDIVLLSSLPPKLDDPSLWEVGFHKAILDALSRQDAQLARAALVEHYEVMTREPYKALRSRLFRDSIDVETVLGRLDRKRAQLESEIGPRDAIPQKPE